MKEQEAIILMQNEITCINRADKCNRDCAKCDLLRDKDELLEAYNMAISALEKHISKKPKTNADRIRTMSDGELAMELHKPRCKHCIHIHNAKACLTSSCQQGILEWLKQEVEDD